MTRLEVLLAELYTDHGIDLIRATAGMSKEVEEKITELAEELVKLLQGRRLPLKNVKEVNAILDEAAKAIKAQYTEIAAAHDANLRQLAVIEGGFASNSINSLVSRPIMLGVGKNRLSAVVANTLIEGAPTKQWWLKQAADVSFRFAGVVRNGFVNGETTEQMVTQIVGRRARGDQPPVKGFMDVSKRAARTLVHNSAQAVANGARMEVYKANSGENGPVKGYRQLSTLDSHTTEICMVYDQKTHNPLVHGSSPCGPTTFKAASCAALCFLRSWHPDQSFGPKVRKRYSAGTPAYLWSPSQMATIVKTLPCIRKAFLSKEGHPTSFKAFRTHCPDASLQRRMVRPSTAAPTRLASRLGRSVPFPIVSRPHRTRRASVWGTRFPLLGRTQH